MSIPVLDAEITPVQKTDIENAITTIKTNVSDVAVVNLTKDQRQSLHKINVERFPYVILGMQHAENNPNLQPSFRSIAEAVKDADLAGELVEIKGKLMQAVEMLDDLSILAQHETYEYFLDFYDNVQQAAKRNVPGVDTILDDLKPLFEKASNDETPDVI